MIMQNTHENDQKQRKEKQVKRKRTLLCLLSSAAFRSVAGPYPIIP